MLLDRLRVRPSPILLTTRADEALTGIRARSSAQLIRVRPGVYADRAQWQSLAPWDRYLARVHAYAAGRPHAVFCLESAAALIGLPIFGEPRDIHCYDPHARGSQRVGDVCVHSARDLKPVRLGEILTTTWAETAVDLMRVLPPAFALAVGDAAVAADARTSLATLRTAAADQSARRGSVQLDWLWPRIDGRSESAGESISRAAIEWSGFPMPEPQVWFTSEGHRDRLDFFWVHYRIGGESDGYGKYLLGPTSNPLDALRKEKRREDRLRSQMDAYRRWEWADVIRVTPLQRKLASAGLPQLYPEQPALLSTLARHPRSK
jgi:hypothetical protein